MRCAGPALLTTVCSWISWHLLSIHHQRALLRRYNIKARVQASGYGCTLCDAALPAFPHDVYAFSVALQLEAF